MYGASLTKLHSKTGLSERSLQTFSFWPLYQRCDTGSRNAAFSVQVKHQVNQSRKTVVDINATISESRRTRNPKRHTLVTPDTRGPATGAFARHLVIDGCPFQPQA